jgi:Lon protease-like protein
MAATYPLFPLPDLLLYPQALMPLQLFEPRYVQMMRDMLKDGQGHLVLGTLKAGFEDDYFERPPCEEIAGLGRIVDVDEMSDNRYRLLVQGETRVRLLEEAPAGDFPYRRVTVEALPEAEPSGADADALRAELRAVIETGATRLARPDEPTMGWLADVLVVQLSGDPGLRQRLFAIVDPSERAHAVLTAMRA